MDLYGEPVVYVDIETSGGSFGHSKIIEIAAIRVEQGQVVREFKTLLNPGTSIPYWITKLTGIKDTDVIGQPYFEEVAHELNDIMDNAIFIAHNVRFDYGFVKRQLEEATSSRYNPKLLCTVRLSRALYPQHKGHSLEKIIGRHGLAVAGRHRAYDDAKAIKDFAELAFQEHGPEVFNAAVSKQLKTRSMPPNLDENSMAVIKNKPGVYVFEDDKGNPMYVGKSINLRNRVLSHFNQDTKVAKEMKISQTTHNIRTIETRNELEALLLESKMVKDLMPLHNRKLRRQRKSTIIMRNENEQNYATLGVEEVAIENLEDLSRVYGVYTTRSKAKKSLENKRRDFDLCPKLLGLEKSKGACFMYQLGKCKGACIGKEPAAIYNARLDIALQRSKMEAWKYKSPVVISTGDGTNIVVDKWIVLGYLEEVEEAEPVFRPVEKAFDMDTYRILRSYIKQHLGSLKIIPISLSHLY